MKTPRCPNCGEKLEAIDLDDQTPPWICRPCVRGWWDTEIDNAKEWDPEWRCFMDPAVLDKVNGEALRKRKGKK